jgi:hypothetical protein
MTHDPTALVLKPTGYARRMLTYLAVLVIGVLVAMSASRNGPRVAAIIGLVVATVGYLALYIRLGARHLILDREGVEVRGLASTQRMAWNEIERYSFVSTDPHSTAGVQGGLAGVLVVAAIKAMNKGPANRTFKAGRLLLRGRGRQLKIGPRYKDIDQGLERVFAELHPRLASSTQFGDIAFDGATLHHTKKGALSITELDKVVVTSMGTITIRKIGKRLGWATVSMARVDNALLLFERLADRGAVIDMANAVFLPLPTLGFLTHVKSLRAGLPQARIQKS